MTRPAKWSFGLAVLALVLTWVLTRSEPERGVSDGRARGSADRSAPGDPGHPHPPDRPSVSSLDEDQGGPEPSAGGAATSPVLSPRAPATAVADPKVAPAKVPAPVPIPENFLKQILSADEKTVTIPLPGGGTVTGDVTRVDREGETLTLVQGMVTRPEPGRFYFQKQAVQGVAGPMAGSIHYDKVDTAYRVSPSGVNSAPVLEQVTVDEVICRSYLPGPDGSRMPPEEAPQSHPSNYPIPPTENGIVPLQSLPGATAVVYLDFDGEEEDFISWGYIKGLPSGTSNTAIYEVWKGVSEDFQPFNINITTQRSVYNAAPEGRRMHVIITPTKDAAPTAGGVAYLNSFNQSGHRVCWVFILSGKNCVEAISHEVGHTLRLSHDGRISPAEGYYEGHNGWAPIMGVGYYQPLSQWSKGEYPSANQKQDDLAIIVGDNNDVDYRTDDAGATYATAPYLDISTGGAVSNEGIIETRADEDAFRFTTTGGSVTLNINNVTYSPNLDIKAEIVTAAGTVVATSDLSASLDASFSGLSLAAGDYILRVSGTGNGDLTTGYSDYGSLGAYLISGTVSGGVHANHFNVVENAANDSAVGAVAARASHGAGVLQYAITSGNTGGAFSIDPATGAITVATSTVLNYEALSTRWDDPAAFELFVSVTDDLGVATESLRTVVTVTNVNEPPVVAPLATLVLPKGLAPGGVVGTVAATDPDRFDFPTYAITGGNTGNTFSINVNTGAITQVGPLNFQTTPSYALAIRVSDQMTSVNQVNVVLNVTLMDTPAGFTPGSATRVFYNGITGSTVSALTSNVNFPNNPSSAEVLSSFDSGTARGDNYGSTIRAYLLAPVTGDYRFWIASDDASELRISPDASVANAVVRASLSSSVSQYNWTGSQSQQSALIPLVAGQVYYIEARHKEGTGSDHVEVAWQPPGATEKEVIPGQWLSPYKQTFPPIVPAQSGTVREMASNGQSVMQVFATDNDAGQTITNYTITAGNGAGLFAIDPATGVITVANGAGLVVGATHVLTVQVTDSDSPALSGTGTITIQVIHLQEQLHAWWKLDEASGNAVADSSGNGRGATLAGSGTWTPSGRTLGGLTLNGTNAHFDYLGNNSLSGTTPFTVMAWVKIPSPLATDGMLIQQREGGSTGTEGQYRVYIRATGQVNFSLSGKNAAGLDDGTQFDFTTTGLSIMDGEWHHVACVRDGSTGRIFVDGVNWATGFGTVKQLGPALTVAVGYDARDNTSFLRGSVDDVRIYSEALGISQIQKIADAPAVAITSPAVDQVQIPTGTGLILEAAAASPDGVAPVATWSKVSGPGTVTFGSAGGINATANFSSVGTYVLRLTASDGGINTGYDEVSVKVGGAPVVNLSGYTYGTGPPGSHTVVSGTSYTLTGKSAGIGESKTSDGFYLLGQTFMGNFDVKTRVVSGTDINGGFAENAGLIVRQGVTGAANGISGYIGCDSTPTEWGYWIRRTTAGALNTMDTFEEASMPLPTWCRLARVGNVVTAYQSDDGSSWITRGTLTVVGEARVGLCWSSGNLSAAGTATFDNVSGFASENIGAAVNAGVDANVAVGATATLDGTMTDDGLPLPAAVTTWSKQSGPGVVTFGNPASIDTTAGSSAPGVHVLRLVANDGQVKTYDDLTLTVTAPPWLTWQILKFAADAANPLIAGDLADPDRDGLVNLLEYALGTDPKQANAGAIVGDMVTVAGVKYLRLSVTKNVAATDVQFAIQVTGDLPNQASWNTAQTVIEVNNTTTLRARDTVNAGQRFIRLKVTRTP